MKVFKLNVFVGMKFNFVLNIVKFENLNNIYYYTLDLIIK